MGVVELWWIADAAIIIGMLAAYNADKVSDLLESTVFQIIQKWVSRNTNLSQNIKRIGKKNKKRHTYNAISLVLMIGFAYNILVNVVAEFDTTKAGRNRILNLLYFVYPLTTVLVSLHDILIHDDRQDWSLEDKQRHIIWPFNFVDSKILGKPIYGDQKVTQLISAKNKMSETTVFGFFAITLLLAKFVPSGAFFLWCYVPFLLHERLNTHLNAVMDYFTISEMKNKFEHFFGNYLGIFKSAESHDQLGMQYEMFKRSFKPAEVILKKQVFNKVRKAKYPVKTAISATYLARGATLSALLFVLGLQNPKYFGGANYNTETSTIKNFLLGSAPIMLYYALHCIIPNMELESKLKKRPFLRMCVWLPLECLASGYLLYKPLLNQAKESSLVLPAVACLAALEVYNKSDVVQDILVKNKLIKAK